MAYVVLEREFPVPMTPEDVKTMAEGTQCLDLYRVRPICSYLHPSGKRMVCVFEAPDAEALRSVARSNNAPEGYKVWPSTLHTQ